MHSEVAPHEKIRFRRGDIAALDTLPSAVPLPRHARAARMSRKMAGLAFSALVCGAIIAALAVAIIVGGLGDERLRAEATRAMAGIAGDDFTVTVGDAGVAIDGLRGFALVIDDIVVTPAEADRRSTRIGSARLGLNLLPLLRGAISVRSLRVADATVGMAALARGEGGAVLPIFDEAGLIDPDLVNAAVFSGVGEALRRLDKDGTRRIEAQNIDLLFPHGTIDSVRLNDVSLVRGAGERLRLTAGVEAAGRKLDISGEATPASFDLRVDIPAGSASDTIEPGVARRFAAAAIKLAGTRTAESGGGLRFSAHVDKADIPVGRRDRFAADLDLVATSQPGTGKIEINRLGVASGRSAWNFHGAFGPAPRDSAPDGGPPSYRYELVSDGSVVSPENSSEPTLAVTAIVAGHLDADAAFLHLDRIGVRSDRGDVSGRAVVAFERGKSPGLELRIDAGAMPAGYAKQLWPWFAASSAQRWVSANLFGGHMEGGWVEMKVLPGRFGDGEPLGRDEVSGFFKVAGTRFDVAGRIPPVRDGSGVVAFSGTDVEIALSSGTVYMPSGRTVAARNGVLDIQNAHIRPVIGKLDIEVEGEADAVLELASYDPIDVGRFVDLKPEDLSGEVRGKVAADIPLQSGIPLDRLDWKVELAYDDLAVARPFQGQTVDAATGTIAVDPLKAVIEAKAQLNGLPATLRLTEPLGRSQQQRQRHIALDMDDKARAALAPGLAPLLSGVAKVEVDDAAANVARTIKADLQSTRLTIPWIGWSKGAGVPATVSFDMKSSGPRTELSGFNLKGETFAATGTVSLDKGGVERVRFPSMRLNRGDDFSLDVARKGAGYAVTVRGKSIDARSLVKLHTRDGGQGEAATPGGDDTPVTVDLKVDAMVGFHGEVLRDVTLSYSGTGARGNLTEFSATTARGGQIVFRDGYDGGMRALSVQSSDAGGLLRFLDIYERMEGGQIALGLSGRDGATMSGRIDARDFWLVDEPRLSSLVSTPSPQDGRSLNQAVRGSLDTSRVQFERGYAEITRGQGRLTLDRGILRGPMIGVSYQGVLNDGNGNMAMTGTFMPAYGLNRIFGEIPLIGQILGNGRDRGLIGITFRLSGRAGEPRLEINPLSVIAPGIFRSVFEFR